MKWVVNDVTDVTDGVCIDATQTSDNSTADEQYFYGRFADYTTSLPAASNVRTDYYELARYCVKRVVIPAVLAFGAIGNVVVLSRLAAARVPPRPTGIVMGSSGASQWAGTAVAPGRSRWRRRPYERSSLVGLTALSVSDLLFCLVGVPAALLTTPGVAGGLGHLYHVCRIPLHNLFLFSSTWIAALVAAERFFVVVSPLRARICLKVKPTIRSRSSHISLRCSRTKNCKRRLRTKRQFSSSTDF